jgi:hypothetical protein
MQQIPNHFTLHTLHRYFHISSPLADGDPAFDAAAVEYTTGSRTEVVIDRPASRRGRKCIVLCRLSLKGVRSPRAGVDTSHRL